MREKRPLSLKKLFWQLTTVAGLAFLFARSSLPLAQTLGLTHQINAPTAVKSVEATEIYSLFTCPCCDQPLKKEEPCCGAMTQMVDFIDQKISSGAGRDEVVLATAQEFGLDRLADEDDRAALRERLLARAPKNRPKIVLAETRKELGKVRQQQGLITTEFTLKNEGTSDLVIDRLSSSCGCTSGSIIYRNQEGPRFYMAGHGYEEPVENWQVAIAPNEEAIVRVYYDPTVHEDLIGPVTRTLSLYSNDPVDFETQLTITLEQVR